MNLTALDGLAMLAVWVIACVAAFGCVWLLVSILSGDSLATFEIDSDDPHVRLFRISTLDAGCEIEAANHPIVPALRDCGRITVEALECGDWLVKATYEEPRNDLRYITCPTCRLVQLAKIEPERVAAGDTFVHECTSCGWMILASELTEDEKPPSDDEVREFQASHAGLTPKQWARARAASVFPRLYDFGGEG
jgi:hypothetical protein